jgi:hypothetical protein
VRVVGKVVNRSSANNPIHIGSLGMNRVVVQSEHLSNLIEEFGLLVRFGVTHGVSSIDDAIKTLIMEVGQNCPNTSLL